MKFVGHHLTFYHSDCSLYKRITDVLARDVAVTFDALLDGIKNPIVVETGMTPFTVSNSTVDLTTDV